MSNYVSGVISRKQNPGEASLLLENAGLKGCLSQHFCTACIYTLHDKTNVASSQTPQTHEKSEALGRTNFRVFVLEAFEKVLACQ